MPQLLTKMLIATIISVKRGVLIMILTIDIGNTNIVLGGFVDDELSFVARIATNAAKT